MAWLIRSALVAFTCDRRGILGMDEEKSGSFWQTIRGIFTAIAAIASATVASVAAVHQLEGSPPQPNPTSASQYSPSGMVVASAQPLPMETPPRSLGTATNPV